MAKDFLQLTPPGRLKELPRYLRALLIRSERAALNPVKDRERAAKVAPYQAALAKLCARPVSGQNVRSQIDDFRWLIEEFKVSLFAQELGTALPVSAKRLDEHLARIQTEI